MEVIAAPEQHTRAPDMHGGLMPKISERALVRPMVPASFPMGLAWFVVGVFSKRERQILAELHKLGFETFCPWEKRVRIIRGRRTETAIPVFQGYLFVSFDRERDDWGKINAVDGVIGIIQNGQFPVRVPDIQITRLKNMDESGIFDKANSLKEGQEVEVTEGPFAGLIAKVKSASPGKRMKILLDALGAIEIDTCFLRKTS